MDTPILYRESERPRAAFGMPQLPQMPGDPMLPQANGYSIDLHTAGVLIFAVLARGLTMRFRLRPCVPWMAALLLAAGLPRPVQAQTDQPFRDRANEQYATEPVG